MTKIHVCKTFVGQPAHALDDLVNRRCIFSSYSQAVATAILQLYKTVIDDELKLQRAYALARELGPDEDEHTNGA